MKTIALFSGYYLPHIGGVERYTYNLAQQFKMMGYRVIVVTTQYDTALSSVEESEICKIYRLPIYRIFSKRYPVLKVNMKYFNMIKQLKSENIDSIIINTRFWITSLLGSHISKKWNIPAFVIEHGTSHFTVGNKFLDRLGHFYEHKITKAIKKNIVDFYGVSREATIWLKHFKIEAKGILYNAIDKGEYKAFEKYLQKEENRIIITYIGRMVEEKGILNLIQAYKKISDKYPYTELILAGKGTLLKKIEKENSNDKKIKILGEISHEQVMKLLGKTNIFVNPSWSEGLPTSILEAGLMKCAVLATRGRRNN